MFDDLAQQEWACSSDILPVSWAQALALECQNLHTQGRFKAASIGHGSSKFVQSQIRGDDTLWLQDCMDSRLHSEVLSVLEQIRLALNQHFYLGLQSVEGHFALYPPGHGYEKHIDNHKGASHRKITFVYYLNEDWATGHGGELSLFDPQGQEEKIHMIEPRLGQLLLFRSEVFPHQVEKNARVRKSLTGWFRDDAL